jgi:hypothetical protein
MSALLYNLDNMVALGPNLDQRLRLCDPEGEDEKKCVHGDVEIIVIETHIEAEVEGCRSGRKHACLNGAPNQLCDSFVRPSTPLGLASC